MSCFSSSSSTGLCVVVLLCTERVAVAAMAVVQRIMVFDCGSRSNIVSTCALKSCGMVWWTLKD